MKKYEDPEMNVVLFDDRTFVNNGVGTSDGETHVNDGKTTTPIEKGGLKQGEEIA